MAKVKQAFPERRFVPWAGRDVDPGEVLDVADDELASWMEGGWEPGDPKTRKAGEQLLADNVITVLAGGKATPAANVKES